MNVQKWIKENTSSLSNKTVAITGSTGGLGVEICRHLASLGANFVFINRNLAKTNSLKHQLENLYPNIKIDVVHADLSNFASTHHAVEILKQKTIDFFILNAGIYAVPKVKTDINYNNIFTTNFVSHYYMVKQLLPNLQNTKGRVVCVGSIAHNYDKINTNDIDFTTSKKHSKVYGNSKRFLMFSLMELFKTETEATLSIVHPGVTLTKMTSHYPKPINWLVKLAIRLFFPAPEKACLNIISAIFNSTEYHEWIGPKLFNIWGYPIKRKLSTCSAVESNKIFEIAENIYSNLTK